MENRYLYRGKRTLTDNMWVYWDGFSGVQPNTVIEEETICQCTGRNDKNGKLIYENDIMVAYFDEENPEHGTYVMVAWREYEWVTIENNSDDPCPLDDFTIKHFEVVGNIFDNPELLEVHNEGE